MNENDKYIDIVCERLYKDRYVDIRDNIVEKALRENRLLKIRINNCDDYMILHPKRLPVTISKTFESQFAGGKGYKLYSYIWEPTKANEQSTEEKIESALETGLITLNGTDWIWMQKIFENRGVKIEYDFIDDNGNPSFIKNKLKYQLTDVVKCFDLIINYDTDIL